jgi:hypothetical protein
MKLTQMALGLSLGCLAVLAGAGCGGSGPDDPLTGTWRNTTCFGSSSTPPDIAKCTVALTFTDDLDVELTAEWMSLPATSMYPRCTTTRRVTGQQWSTKHASTSETLAVTGNGTSTIERADCINEEDNMTAKPTEDISIPSGDTKYQISNGKLTILSGDLAGTYAR